MVRHGPVPSLPSVCHPPAARSLAATPCVPAHFSVMLFAHI